MQFRNYGWLICTLSLAACATRPYNSTTSSSKIPRLPSRILPGGNSNDWRFLANTGQIVIEINDSSITTLNSTSYSYLERKRIINPQQFKYTSIKYKYLLTKWQLDCNKLQYSAISASLYDTLGAPIKTISYTTQWRNIANNSIASQEYNYVCLGTQRQLGY